MPLNTSLEAYAGILDAKRLSHLLKRTLFGTSKAELVKYSGKKLDMVLSSLILKNEDPQPPIVNYTNGADILEPNAKDGSTWINEEWKNDVEYFRLLSLKLWWIDLQLKDTTITEKMILFWHNHVPVEMVGVFHARQAYDYLTTIRKHALGNFKTLIKELTLDPMMLHYLNGTFNEKDSPDENYSRELQELFCIGKGPDSKYSEEDVQKIAKILTGWKSDYLKPKTYFAPRVHDSSDKKLSAFYGNQIIKGREGNDGMKELDDLIEILVNHPECSKFICRKLYRFFVYPEISDEVEKNIITPLAQLFILSKYEILPVIKKLLGSEHFFDETLRSTVIKPPLDYSLGLNKHFGMLFPSGASEIKNRFQSQLVLYYFLTSFQQDIGDPPNVSGWPAYYQFPQFDKNWISTHTVHQRGVHSNMLVYYGYQMFDRVARIDWLSYTDTYARAADPNEFIEDVLTTLFDVKIDESITKYLKQILLSGQISDYYWTDAWKAFKNNPSSEMTRSTVENRLKPFYEYILQLDEYQLY